MSTKHEVICQIEDLENCLSTDVQLNLPRLITVCGTFKQSCDKDLSIRCLASKSGAYPTLLKALEKTSSIQESMDSLSSVLEAMASFFSGNPDLLDDRGTDVLLNVFRLPHCRPINALLLEVVHHCCQKHENNRQRFVERGLVPLVAEALLSQSRERSIVIKTCSVYSILTIDDDVRVMFGKGSEYAKLIVCETDALSTLLCLATGTPCTLLSICL